MKLLIAAGLLVAGQASAQVYRCEYNGRVEYTESPCARGGRTVDTSTSSAGVTGLKKDASAIAGRERQAAVEETAKPKVKAPPLCSSWAKKAGQC